MIGWWLIKRKISIMTEKETESILHFPIPQEAVNVILEPNRQQDVYLVIKLGVGENRTVTYVAAAKENPDEVLRQMKSTLNKPKGSIFAAIQQLGKLFEKYFGTRVRGENDGVAD